MSHATVQVDHLDVCILNRHDQTIGSVDCGVRKVTVALASGMLSIWTRVGTTSGGINVAVVTEAP
jgi:hypothetical protein